MRKKTKKKDYHTNKATASYIAAKIIKFDDPLSDTPIYDAYQLGCVKGFEQWVSIARKLARAGILKPLDLYRRAGVWYENGKKLEF